MGRKNKKENVEREKLQDVDEFESRIKDITLEEYEKYKEVRDKGEIPIYEIKKLAEETGITPDKIFIIGDNYSRLNKKFGFKVINKKKKA